MAQIFTPRANTVARVTLLAIPVAPVIAVVLTYTVMRSPHVTGQQQTLDQPVMFNHEHHAGEDGIDCR